MSPDNNTLIALGLIIKPQGLSGEMLVKPYNDNNTSIRSGLPVVLKSDTINHPGKIQYAKRLGGRFVVKFDSIDNYEEADNFRNCEILGFFGDLLQKLTGEYYVFDLIGLHVIDDGGEVFGKIIDILKSPANDVLVIEHEDSQVLAPFVSQYIDSINIEKGEVVIKKIKDFLL